MKSLLEIAARLDGNSTATEKMELLCQVKNMASADGEIEVALWLLRQLRQFQLRAEQNSFQVRQAANCDIEDAREQMLLAAQIGQIVPGFCINSGEPIVRQVFGVMERHEPPSEYPPLPYPLLPEYREKDRYFRRVTLNNGKSGWMRIEREKMVPGYADQIGKG